MNNKFKAYLILLVTYIPLGAISAMYGVPLWLVIVLSILIFLGTSLYWYLFYKEEIDELL